MRDFPEKLGALHKAVTSNFEQAGIHPAAHEARILLTHRCAVEWGVFYNHQDQIVPAGILAQIQHDVSLRLSGKPLSKILGVQEFYGREFIVSEDALDPRADTETMIDLALKRLPRDRPLRILDLGTGSGCILLTLLCEYPQSTGVAVDYSTKALDIARQNAHRLNIQERCTFIHSSWFDDVTPEYFDLIVSNPPYIRRDVIPALSREVQNHDPILALDGGHDGLDAYKIIFSSLKNFLKPDGLALFEIGFDQREDIMRLGRESRFIQCDVHPDLSGQPRVAEIRCGDKL